VVYLLEDHDFPVVDANALIRAGSIYEPAELVGLASITGQVMRTGGSTTTEGDALDEMLESMGASVEIGIGDTDGNASISTLSADFEKGVRILNDLLRNPAFPQEKIDLAKRQERTEIASRNDEGIGIAFREIPKLIYGADHPYGRSTEYATIEAITRDDLVAFHQEYFHPDRIIFTVYGDFDAKKVKKLFQNVFGDWKKSTKPLPPDPAVTQTKLEGVFVADKEDMTNSVVVLGHEGMLMSDPDYAAMQVFNEVLAGGFSGRIINEIRTKRGLAYAAGATIGAGMHHPGALLFYVLTQADSTVTTLGYLGDEIAKALAQPFTEEEIQRAKDSILNSLVFSFSSKGAVLNRMAVYERYGYPPDFLQKYQAQVQAVTVDEIMAAGRKHIRYPNMATLIVGTKSTFQDALASLGSYTDLDISIPEPAGEEIPEGTAADFEQGQLLLAQAAEAAGGAALAALTDMTVEESGTFSIQGMQLQLSVKTVKKFPDCEWSQQKLPMGTMVQSVCGEIAWMDAMQGPQPMPAEAVTEYRADQARDLIHLLREYGNLKAQALPPTELDGKMVDAVFVRNEAVEAWKIYFDRDTHRIVGMDYKSRSPMTGAPVMAREIMSDYREVGGIQWPYEKSLFHDGEPLATMTTTLVTVNAGVDDSIFAMP
jgi:zinc protease